MYLLFSHILNEKQYIFLFFSDFILGTFLLSQKPGFSRFRANRAPASALVSLACGDMHPKKVTVKKVTGVKLVTLFILILAVTQHIH